MAWVIARDIGARYRSYHGGTAGALTLTGDPRRWAAEPGIPGVRMATPNGLLITSDAEGRFHVPCPMVPNPDRGSNFIMKLDARSLPSGFRVTTENPRDVRLTRGKLVKLNFGATVHRVVRVELSGAAFTAG